MCLSKKKTKRETALNGKPKMSASLRLLFLSRPKPKNFWNATRGLLLLLARKPGGSARASAISRTGGQSHPISCTVRPAAAVP